MPADASTNALLAYFRWPCQTLLLLSARCGHQMGQAGSQAAAQAAFALHHAVLRSTPRVSRSHKDIHVLRVPVVADR